MKSWDNYKCDGQMTIFDFIEQIETNKETKQVQAGQWVEKHGARVFFEDIQTDKYYIADYSTESHKWYKVVYPLEKTENSLMYVDNEKGIKRGWSWGNNYSCLTRKQYVNCDEEPWMKDASTHGWWYEVEPTTEEKQDKTGTEKKSPICRFSEHTCNKEELWRVAEEIGEQCPHTCCRACNNNMCGARCNGAPQKPQEDSKDCKNCINWLEDGCLINNSYERYHKYDTLGGELPQCTNKERYYPKNMSLCENKNNCDDYPLHCKGECFWCHKNTELKEHNCLNCRKYKIECFPEHPTVFGECPNYKQVPDFYDIGRCQLCKHWKVSDEQPAAGWGIDGICDLSQLKTQAHTGCAYFEREEKKDAGVTD